VTCICTCCVAEGRRLRRVCVPRDGFCGGLFFAVDGHWCSDYEAAHGGRYILHTTPCVCTFGVSTHWFQRCPVSLRTTRYPRTHTANPRASILYVASEQVWQVALDDLIRILVSTGVWSEYIWDASRLCTTRSPCAPQKPEPQSSANHSMYAYLVAFYTGLVATEIRCPARVSTSNPRVRILALRAIEKRPTNEAGYSRNWSFGI
jgi:hypothetical protein